MVLLIIIPIKWLFHWEYTQHFQVQTHMVKLETVNLGDLGDPEVSVDLGDPGPTVASCSSLLRQCFSCA